MSDSNMPSLGFCAQLACIWEVTASKPGNVNRYYDFENTAFVDYLISAAAIAPVIDEVGQRRVGETVLEGVRATRQVVKSNTNLGILLLLAPLGAVPSGQGLKSGAAQVLERLDVDDAKTVYEAIRLAEPGGLGQVPQEDVRNEPTAGLREDMGLAADRDLIARQYVNNFRDVFELGVPALTCQLDRGHNLETAIIYSHLRFMATYPDSLIARKCGADVAEEARRRAESVLQNGWPESHGPHAKHELAKFDKWLRSGGNRRNPGTSADLVTASLFVLLREGTIQSPLQYPW